MIAIAFLVALLASGQPARHATDVRDDATDALTAKFADALKKALPQAKHMRLSTGDDADDLTLAVLFNVDADDKRFRYAVDLLKATDLPTPDRLASLTGSCRIDAINACALDVVRNADRKVEH